MALVIPDQTIAAQVKVPDAVNTLSGIMNLQNQQQALKTNQLEYEKNKENWKRLSSIRELATRPYLRNPDGSINMDKFAQDAFVQDPVQGAAVAQGGYGNQQASIANEKSKLGLNSEYANIGLQTASGVLQDPRITADKSQYSADDAAQALEEARQEMINKGVPAHKAGMLVAPYMAQVNNPGAVKMMLMNTVRGQLDASGKVTATQPNGPLINNGQQTTQYNTNQFSGPIGKPVVSVQNQLPPTTPVIGPNNTPGYLGPQGGARNNVGSVPLPSVGGKNSGSIPLPERPSGFVASGLPIGADKGIAGTQETINKHWDSLQTDAKTAQRDLGILQTIKQHAPGAATGVGASRQALVAGIADLIGIDKGTLVKTNTDLLAKNANMLALAGGDTNLARTMAEAASPNVHMNKEAIVKAADQIIAQKKMALAAAKFLTPYKSMADQGHPEIYNKALNEFNAVADPRVIQFKSMTPQEKANMKSSMTPQEQNEFRNKLMKARQLGIAE